MAGIEVRKRGTRGLIALAVLALVGCASPVGGAGDRGIPVEWAVLAAGDQPADAPADGPTMRVLGSRAAFERVYRAMAGEPPPALDHGRHRVLLLDLGWRSTAGYGIGVASVQRTGDAVVVRVVVRRPDDDCMPATVMTRPYRLVRIPIAGGSVRFRKRVETVPCG